MSVLLGKLLWHILILLCDWITEVFPKSKSKAPLLGAIVSILVSLWWVNETYSVTSSIRCSPFFPLPRRFSWCDLGDNCCVFDLIYLPKRWASLLFAILFSVVPVLFIQRMYLVISIYLHLILLNVLRLESSEEFIRNIERTIVWVLVNWRKIQMDSENASSAEFGGFGLPLQYWDGSAF